MKIVLRIQRYNPKTDKAPRYEDFNVDVEPTSRLLDALMFIKHYLDSTLSFRKSCAHGVCGSDAMVINGQERLACKTLVRDVAEREGAVVTIEPLKSLPVQRDLMVDYTHFFDTYRVVKPFLIPKHTPEYGETIQTKEQCSKFADATSCILCASCYSSCPVIAEKDPDFIGPAAALQAARFIFDSRDDGLNSRLQSVDHPHGVWPCDNHFKCTQVCPRSIKVTKFINLTKRHIKAFKEKNHQDT